MCSYTLNHCKMSLISTEHPIWRPFYTHTQTHKNTQPDNQHSINHPQLRQHPSSTPQTPHHALHFPKKRSTCSNFRVSTNRVAGRRIIWIAIRTDNSPTEPGIWYRITPVPTENSEVKSFPKSQRCKPLPHTLMLLSGRRSTTYVRPARSRQVP